MIKDGVSGALVGRSESADDMASRLADAFVEMRRRMLSGTVTPEGVAHEIREFRPEVQLAKCYENHRELQRRRWGAGLRGGSIVSAAASL